MRCISLLETLLYQATFDNFFRGLYVQELCKGEVLRITGLTNQSFYTIQVTLTSLQEQFEMASNHFSLNQLVDQLQWLYLPGLESSMGSIILRPQAV